MPSGSKSIKKNIGYKYNSNFVKRKNVEWRTICREADFYHDAAIDLDECKGEYKYNLFPPVLMNASFACELYSKAIICRYKEYGALEEKKNKTHSLKYLYMSFPLFVKEIVRKIYENGCDIRFEREIWEISDMFEVWRYRYEYRIKSAPYYFVMEYMKALKKYMDYLEMTDQDGFDFFLFNDPKKADVNLEIKNEAFPQG